MKTVPFAITEVQNNPNELHNKYVRGLGMDVLVFNRILDAENEPKFWRGHALG